MSVEDRVQSVVAEFTHHNVEAKESLFDSGLLDSFTLPDMLTALEKEFAIAVPDSDLDPRKFDTVERICAYVRSRLPA